MDIYFLGVGAAALGIYALVSRRLSRSIISGPMFFAAVGFVAVAVGLGEEPTGDVTGVATVALEMTLALVLFTDAMATKEAGRPASALPRGEAQGQGPDPARLVTLVQATTAG